MFNTIIDTIQNGKKQFVSTFVTDTKLKTDLEKLVDAQTKFAKGQVETTLSIAEAFATYSKDAYAKAIAKAGV